VVADSHSIQAVFTVAVPIAAVAFLASWLIPQVELRRADGGGRPRASGPTDDRAAALAPPEAERRR